MAPGARLEDPAGRFAAVLCDVDAELDWSALGAHYCDGEAPDFFDPAAIEGLRDAGLRMASDLAAELSELPRDGARSSLYVGVGVFELPLLLCETIVLGRRVVVHTLESDERRAIARALRRAGQRAGLRLPGLRTEPVPRSAGPDHDHLWMVSVLTDPEVFPALHDRLYERAGTPLATGRGHLPRERAAAAGLVDRALSGLAVPGLLSTTDEELPLLREGCDRRGLRLLVPERARLSGIVGDPVRHCRLREG